MTPTRTRFLMTSTLLAPAFLMALTVHAQQAPAKTGAPAAQKKAATPSPEAAARAKKIADAMSAAPTSVSKDATIMDWPATMTGKPVQIRAGKNGWVCYPSMPPEMVNGAVGEDPMCLDKQWQGWLDAYMSKTTPKPTASGIAYMLRGDRGASNTDPAATGQTATNQWVVSPGHIMVLYPDPKMLDAYPTDPTTGGPWVMWKGTPFAHVMVPVVPKGMATMPK